MQKSAKKWVRTFPPSISICITEIVAETTENLTVGILKAPFVSALSVKNVFVSSGAETAKQAEVTTSTVKWNRT